MAVVLSVLVMLVSIMAFKELLDGVLFGISMITLGFALYEVYLSMLKIL